MSKNVIGKRITLARSVVCNKLAAKIEPSENVMDIMNCERTVGREIKLNVKTVCCDNFFICQRENEIVDKIFLRTEWT